MPVKQVFQYTCDRCGRVWFDEKKVDPPSFEANFKDGEEVLRLKFESLCGPCKKTCKNVIKNIGKSMTKPSPERGASKKARGDGPSKTSQTPTAPSSTPVVRSSSTHRPTST
jgi:hypothetical protein